MGVTSTCPAKGEMFSTRAQAMSGNLAAALTGFGPVQAGRADAKAVVAPTLPVPSSHFQLLPAPWDWNAPPWDPVQRQAWVLAGTSTRHQMWAPVVRCSPRGVAGFQQRPENPLGTCSSGMSLAGWGL